MFISFTTEFTFILIVVIIDLLVILFIVSDPLLGLNVP